MSIPTNTTTDELQYAQLADKLRQSARRDASLLVAMFNLLWTGDTATTISRFQSLNTYAANRSTTAKAVIDQHRAIVLETIGRVPDTAAQFSAAPLDLSTLYDGSDMVDIPALTAALNSL